MVIMVIMVIIKRNEHNGYNKNIELIDYRILF